MRPSSRRAFVLSPLALGWLASMGTAATLPVPESLQAALAAALKNRDPLVVLASLEGCPFCKVVRDSYLAPLHKESGLPVIQLDSGSRRAVLDLHGRASTHDALLRAWGIRVTPTVLFLGPAGAEVAPRLVGASIPDFYGAYLDERLRIARTRLA